MVIYAIIDPAFGYFKNFIGFRIAREWSMKQTIVSIPLYPELAFIISDEIDTHLFVGGRRFQPF